LCPGIKATSGEGKELTQASGTRANLWRVSDQQGAKINSSEPSSPTSHPALPIMSFNWLPRTVLLSRFKTTRVNASIGSDFIPLVTAFGGHRSQRSEVNRPVRTFFFHFAFSPAHSVPRTCSIDPWISRTFFTLSLLL